MSRYIAAPICDDCWKARERERQPVRMREPAIELCHYCGKPTDSGIYQRAPAKEPT